MPTSELVSTPTLSARTAILVSVGALLVLSFCSVQAGLHAYQLTDDAFIFMRYADNVLGGAGLVFNPGERVEGFSSPAWLLLLTLGKACGIPLPVWATILGCSAGLAVVLILCLANPGPLAPSPFLRWLAAALLVSQLSFTYWLTAGMETLLVALLSLGTLLCFAHETRTPGRHYGSGVLAGLLALGRPDALLLLPALAPLWLAEPVDQRRKQLMTFFISFTPLPLAYLAFRLCYYGALLPNTAHAKLALSPAHLAMGLDYVRAFYLSHPLAWLALLPLLFRDLRRAPLILSCYAFVALHVGYLIACGGDFFEYHRFFAPLLPLFALLAICGLNELAQIMARRVHLPAMFLLSIAAAAAWAGSFDPLALAPSHGGEFTVASGKLGRALAREFPAGTRVACPHIGAVGYYSRLPILDLLGLVDPHIARATVDEAVYRRYPFRSAGHEKFDIPYTLARRPGVIALSRAATGRKATDLSEMPRAFAAEHALLDAVLHAPDYVLDHVTVDQQAYWMILRRRDVAHSVVQSIAPNVAPNVAQSPEPR